MRKKLIIALVIFAILIRKDVLVSQDVITACVEEVLEVSKLAIYSSLFVSAL